MTYFNRALTGLLAAGLALAQGQAHSQAHDTPPQNIELQKQEMAQGDPARWYQEDATPQERARTLRKEIGAALAEANQACKKGPAGERGACIKEARATYQKDMAGVGQMLGQVQNQGNNRR